MTNYLESAYQAWHERRNVDAQNLCRAAIEAVPSEHAAFNLLGVLAGERSEHAAAVQFFAKAVELSPAADNYRNNLVKALLADGRFPEAQAMLRTSLEHDAGNADCWRQLAYLHVRQQEFKLAGDCYDRAIQIEPTVATNYFGKAEVHRFQGELGPAIECLKQALNLAPDNEAALNNLVGLQMANGDFLEALISVKRLLDKHPRSAQAYCNLASLLSVSGDEIQAVIALRNALVLAPDLYRARYLLASMLINIGGLDESEAILRKLIDENRSNSAPCTVALVRLLERKGELQEAEQLMATLDPSLESYPEAAIARAVLLEQSGEEQMAVRVLEKAMDDYPGIAAESINMQFMLGNLHDKLGNYDAAFTAFELGNANRRKAQAQFATSDETRETLCEKSLRLFDADHFARCPASDLETLTPVFIVGMPRSGTTLVEQILAAHPQVHGGGELNFLQELIGATYATSASSSAFEILAADRFSGEQYTVPYGWGGNSKSQIVELAKRYLEQLQALCPTADRITNKLPYNFTLVPLIHRLFPRARIIHCVRHPLDTCLSCFFQNFSSGNQFSFDLLSLGQYYRDYFTIMQAWKQCLHIPMMEVQYEDIVQSPEPNIHKLLDYIGLDWNENCANFHRSKRVVHTASYQQVRQPLYTTSVGKWRNYAEHLQPLIEALGDLAYPN